MSFTTGSSLGDKQLLDFLTIDLSQQPKFLHLLVCLLLVEETRWDRTFARPLLQTGLPYLYGTTSSKFFVQYMAKFSAASGSTDFSFSYSESLNILLSREAPESEIMPPS